MNKGSKSGVKQIIQHADYCLLYINITKIISQKLNTFLLIRWIIIFPKAFQCSLHNNYVSYAL